MIVLLHGFLGQGKDWQDFAGSLTARRGETVLTPSLFRPSSLFPPPPRARADVSVVEKVLRNGLNLGLSLDQLGLCWANAWKQFRPGERPLWIGYSFGGRLLAHALVQGLPALGAVFVSANPIGWAQHPEREERAKQDDLWAQRFERDPWAEVVADWNDQPVLRDSPEIPRTESDYDRALLAAALRVGSLARQRDLCPELADIECETMWIAGERDEKYRALMKSAASAIPHAHARVVAEAGHRAPWDNSEDFERLILDFMDRLSIDSKSR